MASQGSVQVLLLLWYEWKGLSFGLNLWRVRASASSLKAIATASIINKLSCSFSAEDQETFFVQRQEHFLEPGLVVSEVKQDQLTLVTNVLFFCVNYLEAVGVGGAPDHIDVSITESDC